MEVGSRLEKERKGEETERRLMQRTGQMESKRRYPFPRTLMNFMHYYIQSTTSYETLTLCNVLFFFVFIHGWFKKRGFVSGNSFPGTANI